MTENLEKKNNHTLRNSIIILLVFFLGMGAMFGVYYYFPNIKEITETRINKNVTVTDTGIADAVEKLFNVKVLKVNTMNIDGKQKRVGVHQGKTASWKKAIVFIDTDPQTVTYTKKGGKEAKGTKKFNSSIEEFMGA